MDTVHASPGCNQPQPGPKPVPELVGHTRRGRAAPKVPCSEVSTPVVSIRAMPTSCARPARWAPARPAPLCHFRIHQQTLPGLIMGSTALLKHLCVQVTRLHRPKLEQSAACQAAMLRPVAAAHRDARAAVAREQDVGALQVPVHDLRVAHSVSLTKTWQSAACRASEAPATHVPRAQHACQATLRPASAGMAFSKHHSLISQKQALFPQHTRKPVRRLHDSGTRAAGVHRTRARPPHAV